MSYGERKAKWIDQETGIPVPKWINHRVKNEFVAAIGEYVGTVLFLFFAYAGTQVANSPAPIVTPPGAVASVTGSNPPLLLYISLSFGFSLAVNAWVFYRISGGLFNPAVTLGMLIAGALSPIRAAVILVAQLLGGITSAAIVSALFPGDLKVKTTLGGNTSTVQGLFIEMFLTAELVFTIFMLAAEKTKATFLAPIGIGLSLFIAELAGVYYTGGSLNPARSFGPCVVLRDFEDYHWIYWVGPSLGALVAAGFYKFIKILEYESANPDQDLDNTVVTAELRPVSSDGKDETDEKSGFQRDGGHDERHRSTDLESGINMKNSDAGRICSKPRSKEARKNINMGEKETGKDLLAGEVGNNELLPIQPADAVSQIVQIAFKNGSRRTHPNIDSHQDAEINFNIQDYMVARRRRQDNESSQPRQGNEAGWSEINNQIRRRSAMENAILQHGSLNYAINPENLALINLEL